MLLEDFQAGPLSIRVDIVDWNALSESFKTTIQTTPHEVLLIS
jgi:hypothetical protein